MMHPGHLWKGAECSSALPSVSLRALVRQCLDLGSPVSLLNGKPCFYPVSVRRLTGLLLAEMQPDAARATTMCLL